MNIHTMQNTKNPLIVVVPGPFELCKMAPVVLRRVVLESPYSGNREQNAVYLDRAIRDSLRRGESPFASHRMFTSALDDDIPSDRELGMKAGFAWRASAMLTVVYEDYGISGGMLEGMEDARAIGQSVEKRKIGPNP